VSSSVGLKETNVLEQRFMNHVPRDGWDEVYFRCVPGKEDVSYVFLRHGLCAGIGGTGN